MRRVLLLFVLLFVVGVFGAKKLTAEQKTERMIKNWKMINEYTSANYITRIRSEDDFYRYLVRSPRNYTVIILFNTDRECYACRQVDTHFESLAVAAKENRNITGPQEIFFFRVAIEGMYSVGTKMGVQTAPALLYVPSVRGIGFPHKRHQYLYYPTSKLEMSTYEMSQFIEEKSGIQINGFSAPWNTKMIYIGTAITIGVLPFLIMLIRNPRGAATWFYAVTAVFFLDMAGFVGNAVHGNQWAQYNMMTGEYMFVNRSLQRQFQLEGYSAAFLLVFASACFISIVHFLPKIKSGVKKQVSFIILLLLLISSLNSWMALYCYKNPSYPFQYFFDWFSLIQWFSATVHEYTGIAL